MKAFDDRSPIDPLSERIERKEASGKLWRRFVRTGSAEDYIAFCRERELEKREKRVDPANV
ncbi:MAG: hypothetical protein IKI64_10880 [Clostridia bacterium]|nr:hypothetical protein [Clostridia bacterium]